MALLGGGLLGDSLQSDTRRVARDCVAHTELLRLAGHFGTAIDDNASLLRQLNTTKFLIERILPVSCKHTKITRIRTNGEKYVKLAALPSHLRCQD